MELVDPRLGDNFQEREVQNVVCIALLCTQAVAAARPKMSEALEMLTGAKEVSFSITKPNFLSDLRRLKQEKQENPLLGISTGDSRSDQKPPFSNANHTVSLVEPR